MPTVWSEKWHAAEEWPDKLRTLLESEKIPCTAGGPYDNWDLQVDGGLLGGTRLVMAVEEHGAGRQMLKFRVRRRLSSVALFLVFFFLVLFVAAAMDKAWFASGVLVSLAFILTARMLYESAISAAAFANAIRTLEKEIRND